MSERNEKEGGGVRGCVHERERERRGKRGRG